MNSPCEKMRDKIADYVIGVLSDDEIRSVELHINQCSECKEYAHSLQEEKQQLLQFAEKHSKQMQDREDKVIDALNQLSIEKDKRTSIGRIIIGSKITKLAAAVIIIVCLFFAYNKPQELEDKTVEPNASDTVAKLTTLGSLSFAYRNGGMEMFDQQCDQALKLAGPRLASMSLYEF